MTDCIPADAVRELRAVLAENIARAQSTSGRAISRGDIVKRLDSLIAQALPIFDHEGDCRHTQTVDRQWSERYRRDRAAWEGLLRECGGMLMAELGESDSPKPRASNKRAALRAIRTALAEEGK